ncbi:hypothetical protein EAS68_08150 [Legionella jordanis]|uniref:hypothetical protein n=1 Tax=Legionella jordanis TaxID=456 RepID=UPI000EFE61E9|nr:hypothetical protein [Legionella jordanis]RMX18771.1 hypothetical protein EAS68_08150 [Legionella jordanis]
MKILFINIADHKPLGIKAVEALTKKYHPSFFEAKSKTKITSLHLMHEAIEFAKSGSLNLSDTDYETLGFWLKNRKAHYKIIIGAHGQKDDVDFCYAQSDEIDILKANKLLSAEQLAHFMASIFRIVPASRKSPVFTVMLSICYGARSEEFDRDHIQEFSTINWQSSLAAKVYAHLIQYFPIKMKAATGAVEFDTKNGNLLIESEEALRAHQKFIEVARQLRTFENEKIKPLAKEYIARYGERKWLDYEKKMEYKRGETALDKVFLEFEPMKENLEIIRELKSQNSKKDYGQVVFNFDKKSEQVIIHLKHGGKQMLLVKNTRANFVESCLQNAVSEQAKGLLDLEIPSFFN